MGFCVWADINEANRVYHDTEWGLPVHDDRRMFEHLSLECLQCGLSWDLMLKKRAVFRQCFDNFDYEKIAAYGEADVKRIMNTEGMLKSERKVRAIISNAQCCLKIREEYGSFCNYIWRYTGDGFVRRSCRGKRACQQRPVGNHQQGFKKARLQVCRGYHRLFPSSGVRRD